MLPPKPRPKVEYKKPRKINVVSVTLFLCLAAAVYLIVGLWPLITLRGKVKAELADSIPHFWRLNLRPEHYARPEIAKLKKGTMERLRKLGVKDKKLELVMERGKERIAMEARFKASALLPYWEREVELRFSTRVETDAARVDW